MKKSNLRGMDNGWYIPGGFSREEILQPGPIEQAVMHGIDDEPLTIDDMRNETITTTRHEQLSALHAGLLQRLTTLHDSSITRFKA